jgi:Uma2 family endonuclease
VPGFLAVEVISPRQGPDLIEKAIRYAAWGTPHVWIINPETRICLEFHGGDTFTVQREQLHASAQITLRVADIFSKLSKAEERGSR